MQTHWAPASGDRRALEAQVEMLIEVRIGCGPSGRVDQVPFQGDMTGPSGCASRVALVGFAGLKPS
jgi:hypothetical protein